MNALAQAPKARSIRWLHLSDLHAGAPKGQALAHPVFDELRRDIERMAGIVGPPDLILFTGDLAYSGREDEYQAVDDALDRIRAWLDAVFREAHPGAVEPLLFAVPGNHDLARPGRRAQRMYSEFDVYDDGDNPDVAELRDELWSKEDVGLLAPLFTEYTRWSERQVLAPLDADPRAVIAHPSYFPGDLSARIDKDGFRLGLVGLNSAWLQYTGGDFEGKLHLPVEQLHAALPDREHPLEFFESCDSALLLMHHPPSWLSPSARRIFHSQIVPSPERFDLCLYGHVHQARSEITAISGTEPRAYFQAPSLCGLERYGSKNEERRFGYAWGEIRDDGGLRVWPRILVERGSERRAFDRDPRFKDPEGDGSVWLRKPRPASPSPSPPVPPVPPAPGAPRRPPDTPIDTRQSDPADASDDQAPGDRDDQAPGDRDDFTGHLSRYLAWARESHQHLDMAGVGGGHLRLAIDQVCIPLRFSRRSAHEDAPFCGEGLGRDHEAQRDIDLLDAFARALPARHLFLLGDPGSGKTTALEKLLWSILHPVSPGEDAGDRPGDETPGQHGQSAAPGPHLDGTAVGLAPDTIPVFLRLRSLTDAAMREPLEHLLDAELARTASTPPGFGPWLWRRGRLLLLLDGLDEIADPRRRARVCRYLETELARADDRADPTEIRAAVSCRFAGLGEHIGFGPKFAQMDIHPLDERQIADLITRWFTAAEQSMARSNRSGRRQLAEARARGRERGRQVAEQLRQAEHTSHRLQTLAGNPLLLTLLCVVVFNGREIPRKRVTFFADCLRILLGRWRRGFGSGAPLLDDDSDAPLLDDDSGAPLLDDDSGAPLLDDDSGAPLLDDDDALRLLRPIAWRMHVEQRKYDLPGADLYKLLRREIDRLATQLRRPLPFGRVLDWLCRDTGVLTEFAPGEYGFFHLSFQEYLAATHAARDRDEGLAKLIETFGQEWWQEVALLFVALGEYDNFVPLIEPVIADERLLTRSKLLRMCLEEAHAPDTGPFAAIIESDPDDERRSEAMRLVLHRVDERIRDAATDIAMQGGPLQALAERLEAQPTPRLRAGDADGSDETWRTARDAPGPDQDMALQSPTRESMAERPFDVFLSHREADRGFARALHERLRDSGRKVWLDERELIPGRPRQEMLEQAIASVQCAAVLVGPGGLGPWQEREVRAFLVRAVDEGVPVIPVFLPGVPDEPALPRFLGEYVGVDLRGGLDSAGLDRLLAGVPGGDLAGRPETPDRRPGKPARRAFEDATTGIRFLWIPGGEFRMGLEGVHLVPEVAKWDRWAQPPHRVRVSPFWLGETAVTNAHYQVFLESSGRGEPKYWRDRRFNAPDQPVVGVSWLDAMAFCAWLGERTGQVIALPSEAQWEFAARGPENRRYPWGEEPPSVALADFDQDYKTGQPRPVGSFPQGRGPSGTLDQAGSVWEWCRDVFEKDVYEQRGELSVDPLEVGPEGSDQNRATARPIRGGAWFFPALNLRAAFRGRDGAGSRSGLVGFRVAAVPPAIDP